MIILVYPNKKITSVKTKSILKRMKQKEFASGVDREAGIFPIVKVINKLT